jgi:predicted membrane channel-forming protein YqfA (hemolysin III family)
VCLSVALASIKLDKSIGWEAIVLMVLSGIFFAIGVFVYYLSIARIKKTLGGDTISAPNNSKIKINTNV